MFRYILYAIIVVLALFLLACLLYHGKSRREPYKKTKGEAPTSSNGESMSNEEYLARLDAVRFFVDRTALEVEPDPEEVFFYTPVPAPELEGLIVGHYKEIAAKFKKRGYKFVFLPEFNATFCKEDNKAKCAYFNPHAEYPVSKPVEILSYEDIRQAYSIPEKVDGPCLIRCKRADMDSVPFSFCFLRATDQKSLFAELEHYLQNVGGFEPLYRIASEEELRRRLDGKPADERFETDIYLLEKEVRERVEKLRSLGLSQLAILRLVGDEPWEPSRMRIDREKRIILTDYKDKEIKLEPLHKAVYFLFLLHTEGILFKDLVQYETELRNIYQDVTGRNDLSAIEKSIKRLVDPYDNSINEKCARIKNAFISEFREDLAKWYYIDGRRGESKRILLPRFMVTWED